MLLYMSVSVSQGKSLKVYRWKQPKVTPLFGLAVLFNSDWFF